jgi:tetratricopeptide (TPR) repeat protein
MRTDIYIKIIILFVCAYFIYSSINEYRYNSLLNTGLEAVKSMHKKNASIIDYTTGFAMAEDNFKKAIMVKHNRDEAYYYLATLYTDYINSEFEKKLSVTEQAGLTDDIALREAISDLEKASAINPYNADACLALAWLYEHGERHKEADMLVARAEALWPEKIRILQKVFEWAVLRKDYSKAKKLIDKIYAINPGLLQNFLNILWRVEQDYEKLKELVPQQRKAREIFARFLNGKKLSDKANLEVEYAKTLPE